MMPGEWSKTAMVFFHRKILDGLPPSEEEWFDSAGYKTWLNSCGGGSDDSTLRLAYYLTIARDEDTLMVPICKPLKLFQPEIKTLIF